MRIGGIDNRYGPRAINPIIKIGNKPEEEDPNQYQKSEVNPDGNNFADNALTPPESINGDRFDSIPETDDSKEIAALRRMVLLHMNECRGSSSRIMGNFQTIKKYK
ncbi:MAG TPA: hypothetical protein PLZ62_02770 [bacterium]|nr:hypothetical protein [bacterium]